MEREVLSEYVDQRSGANVFWFARLFRVNEQSAGWLSGQTELRHAIDQGQDRCFEKLLMQCVNDLADVSNVDV